MVSLTVVALCVFFVAPWFSGLFGLFLLAMVFGIFRYFKLPKGTYPTPQWLGQAVGHRGLREKRAPENSLLSLDLALTESVDSVEIDIHLSKDGEIVVFHDQSLTRMMGVNKSINDCTTEELWGYRYAGFNGVYDKEGIPTLDKVLDLVLHKHNGQIFIELKGIAVSFQYMNKIADKLVAIYKKFNCYETATVISFNPVALYILKKKCPKISTCLLYYPGLAKHAIKEFAPQLSSLAKSFFESVDFVLTKACRSWLPEFIGASWVGPNFQEVNESYVAKWKGKGIGVYTWTVNDKRLSSYLRELGVACASDSFDSKLKRL